MENLTLETFKTKVYDFETNTEAWKFEGTRPCVLDFYADWCTPCKQLLPVLEELSKEYDGKVDIYKINTEEQHELAAIFGIQSIPSLLFIPMNEEPQMTQGALPKESLITAFKDVLKVE